MNEQLKLNFELPPESQITDKSSADEIVGSELKFEKRTDKNLPLTDQLLSMYYEDEHYDPAQQQGVEDRSERTSVQYEHIQDENENSKRQRELNEPDKACVEDGSALEENSTEHVERDSEPKEVLDLSRQQRNLLLMRPLFELELSKGTFKSSAGEPNFMEGIDCNHLVLSLLDFLMEGVAIGSGRYPHEIIDYLARCSAAMSERLSEVDRKKVAENVLNHLSNRKQNFKEFSYGYFDARSKRTRQQTFRLLKWVPDSRDENYIYVPTEEGYLVYLGMLDLAPEDTAQLMEKMLQILIDRNRFVEAIDIAKKARTLSIEFRQIIRETIRRAKRTPRGINWTVDIAPKLDSAREHVSARRAQDEVMLTAVRDSLRKAHETSVRENIGRLQEILQNCGGLRSSLHIEVMKAPDEYLYSQTNSFKVRGPSNLPSLEEAIFPEMMATSIVRLSECADAIVSSSYPCKFPHIFELNSVFSLLLEKRSKPAVVEEEDGGTVLLEKLFYEMFTLAQIQKAADWIAEQFSKLEEKSIEELLQTAEDSALDRPIILCIALYLFISVPELPQFSTFDQFLTENPFKTKNVRGTNIVFKRRDASK